MYDIIQNEKTIRQHFQKKALTHRSIKHWRLSSKKYAITIVNTL